MNTLLFVCAFICSPVVLACFLTNRKLSSMCNIETVLPIQYIVEAEIKYINVSFLKAS